MPRKVAPSSGREQCFAERDDDEELAALGEMTALDRPLARLRSAEPGKGEAGHRRHIFEEDGDGPEEQAQLVSGERAGDPEAGRHSEPRRHAAVIGRKCGGAIEREDHEQCAAELDRDIAAGKDERLFAERVGDRGGHHQREQHQHEQETAEPGVFWVEPVGDPAGILPAEPDREPEDQCFERADEAEVVEQRMAELGDREDIDEVEEQLFEGHARVMAVAVAQHRAAGGAGVLRRHWAVTGLACMKVPFENGSRPEYPCPGGKGRWPMG